MTTQHLTASDLMIGDWVLYRPGWIDDDTETPVYESENGFPVRLICIYNDLAQYDDILPDGTINTIEVADFELFPIPITPEILEKNGWHRFQVYYHLGIDEQQYMEYYPLLGRLQRIYKHKDNKEEVVFTCGALSYVHLLQHALKLCQIDKELPL